MLRGGDDVRKQQCRRCYLIEMSIVFTSILHSQPSPFRTRRRPFRTRSPPFRTRSLR